MSKVKLGLFRMAIPGKVALANTIVTAMTGNPNFPTPVPPLAAITSARTAMVAARNAAETARATAKNATDNQNNAEKALDAILTQIALYVENVSGGNEAIISSAGMNVRAPATPIGPLAVPVDLAATAGDNDGEIDLNWEPVWGASSYTIQMSSDPPGNWQFKQNANESRARIFGLTSGVKYWFRVAGMGAAGQGPFSDPATKYAP